MPKIAFISVAHIHSRSFCEATAKFSSLKAPGVIWDENPERGAKYAADFKCAFEPHLDKVLADKSIDGFVVTAENTRHLPLLRKVLPLGKPVLCEKPLATTAADADEAVALAKKYGAKLTCGYCQPFFGPNLGAKKLLAEKALGHVTHINFRNAHNAAYGRWFDNPELQWFTQPELSGGGALLDLGTHAVHCMRHFGGPVAEVWAMITNVSGAYPAVDDYGVIMMKFANGIIGRAEAGWVSTGGHGGLEIIGSEKAVWDSNGLKVGGPGIPAENVVPEKDKPTRIERLIAIIKGELSDEELDHDIECCRDTVRIMAAAYESAAKGVWVAV